jgi:hypothetical protein
MHGKIMLCFKKKKMLYLCWSKEYFRYCYIKATLRGKYALNSLILYFVLTHSFILFSYNFSFLVFHSRSSTSSDDFYVSSSHTSIFRNCKKNWKECWRKRFQGERFFQSSSLQKLITIINSSDGQFYGFVQFWDI